MVTKIKSQFYTPGDGCVHRAQLQVFEHLQIQIYPMPWKT